MKRRMGCIVEEDKRHSYQTNIALNITALCGFCIAGIFVSPFTLHLHIMKRLFKRWKTDSIFFPVSFSPLPLQQPSKISKMSWDLRELANGACMQ
ncbi:hypothetical protein BT69DRAFT_1035758 [Atractiella rhizophila]|nr:hypothetical protein BT69DRAFT_1035758 [Atractiella rhizophila]